MLELLVLRAYSQNADEHPQSFLSTTFNTFIITNEIRNEDSTRINLSSYLRKNTGLFSDVYQTNTGIAYHKKQSTFSIRLHSDVQGELISRSRVYADYNIHIALRKNMFAFAGTSLGVVNKSVGDNTTSTQGTSSTFDASAIVGMYSRRLFGSVSMHQIPQSILKPIQTETTLKRYYQLYLLASTESYQDYIVDGVGMVHFYEGCPNEYIAGLQMRWKREYKLGYEYSSYSVSNFFVDILLMQIEHLKLSTLVSYETSHSFNKSINGTFSVFNVGLVVKL